MSRRISDNLVSVLHESCVLSGTTQKTLADSLHKSVATIQYWETGTVQPPFWAVVEWIETCGYNPLRFYLNYLYPDKFNHIWSDDPQKLRSAIAEYYLSAAPDSEVKKMAYSIFGPTGSSWQGQVDEICAGNQLPISARIDVAEVVYSKYCMARDTGTILHPDMVQPDMDNLRSSIDACKKAVIDGHTEYCA